MPTTRYKTLNKATKPRKIQVSFPKMPSWLRQAKPDADGNVLDDIDFASFGQVLNETHPENGDRFKFAGGELFGGLQNHWHRWYDAGSGRFVSEDPLRFKAGDTNLYRYVGNAPTYRRDLSGLADWVLFPTGGFEWRPPPVEQPLQPDYLPLLILAGIGNWLIGPPTPPLAPPVQQAAELGVDLSRITIQNGVAQIQVGTTQTLTRANMRALAEYLRQQGATSVKITGEVIHPQLSRLLMDPRARQLIFGKECEINVLKEVVLTPEQIERLVEISISLLPFATLSTLRLSGQIMKGHPDEWIGNRILRSLKKRGLPDGRSVIGQEQFESLPSAMQATARSGDVGHPVVGFVSGSQLWTLLGTEALCSHDQDQLTCLKLDDIRSVSLGDVTNVPRLCENLVVTDRLGRTHTIWAYPGEGCLALCGVLQMLIRLRKDV